MNKTERLALLAAAERDLDSLLAVEVLLRNDRPWAVRIADLPEPYQSRFRMCLRGSQTPSGDLAYLTDYSHFLSPLVKRIQQLAVPLVSEQPSVVIEAWNLLKRPRSAYWRLIGRVVADGHFRETSGVVEFDLQNMRLLTESGRLYHLRGGPVRNPELETKLSIPALRELGGSTLA